MHLDELRIKAIACMFGHFAVLIMLKTKVWISILFKVHTHACMKQRWSNPPVGLVMRLLGRQSGDYPKSPFPGCVRP